MIKRLNDFHSFLQKTNSTLLVFLFTVINLITSTSYSYILSFFTNEKLSDIGFSEKSVNLELLIVVLIAPFIETFIFQHAVIELLYKKLNSFALCALSASLFSLSHFYSLSYVMFTFLMGLILAYLFIIGKLKKRSFILVFTVHALYNLIVFILSKY